MIWGVMQMSAEKASGTETPLRKADQTRGLLKKTPVVLDMGEASREEGFRLNGCR